MPPRRTLQRARPVRAALVGLAASAVVIAWLGNEPSITAPIKPPADAPVFVRYEVTSTSADATAHVTYQTSCGDTVSASGTSLPWSMTLSVRPGALAAVSAELEGEGGIQVRLLVNGVVLDDESARGSRAAAWASEVP
jgi:hypothetical protein